MNAPATLDRPTSLSDVQRGVDIDGLNVRLYFLSRNWKFLALVVIGMLGLAAALALGLGNHQPTAAKASAEQLWQAALHRPTPDAFAVTHLLFEMDAPIPATIEEDLQKANFAPKTRFLLNNVAASLRAGLNEPNAELLILAHRRTPEAGANECVADFHARRGAFNRACDYYRRELNVTWRPETRAKLVHVLLRQGDFPSLVPLVSDPAYAPFFSPATRLKVAFYERNWGLAATRLLEMEFATMQPLSVVMALAAAIAWLCIAIHICQPHGRFSFRTIAPCIAVFLGFLGALGTQFVAAWQEELLGIRETGEFVSDLGYYAGLVAPRETLIKLLLILPFVPRLLARRSPLDTLVVTGCVGLGFAIESSLRLCNQDNLGYSLGRLLTANFFHFSASALLGLAFCRWLARVKGAAVSTMLTLLAIALTQGVYDAFTRISAAQAFVAVAAVPFLILSRAVFSQLHRWRDSFTDQCFLGATLVLSLSALVGTLLVTASIQFGFDHASWALLCNTPILLMVVIVFFGQFKRGFAAIGDDLVSPASTL